MSSPSPAGSRTPSPPSQRRRPSLRQATLILPHTGERVKKRVNLRGYNGNNHSRSPSPRSSRFSDDRQPLLQHRGDGLSDTNAKVLDQWHTITSFPTTAKRFMTSEVGKGVLKCSLAYLLGSLATFVPALSGLLGAQDGKHIVATITVYFHPARSRGSMFQATICAFAAFLYAAFLSITSMAVTAFFADTAHQIVVGHVLVLIIFCGGGLGAIGWYKQRKGDNLVNVACSLASLASITVLTKEGSIQAGDISFAKISQVLKMLLMGIVSTMAVSFLIFPISARKKLRLSMVEATDALGEMLALIASSFLSGFEDELEQEPFKETLGRHKKAYAKLGQNLKEAKLEQYVTGREFQYHIEAKLVYCLQRITHTLGGLRSAAAMQFALIEQTPEWKYLSQRSQTGLSSLENSFDSSLVSKRRSPSRRPLSLIVETPEDEPDMQHLHGEPQSHNSGFRSPSDIFTLFIAQLGPSMSSLAFTLKEILDELPYTAAPTFKINVNPKFRTSLDRAITLYKESRKEAIKLVYTEKIGDRERPMEVEADYEEVAASCGHFSYSLLEVAEQVKEYLDILDELQLEVTERPNGRTWNWLKFWRQAPSARAKVANDPEYAKLIDHANELSVQISLPEPQTDLPIREKQHLPRKKDKINHRIWKALSVFRRDDIRFAIKVGIGAALYALPAYLDQTRPFYAHWRGEWGLLSYMLVCSMTIGASNTTGYSRFVGTCIGGICALVIWEISNDNPYALAFFGWLMSLWTAYIIVGKGKGPMGRYIMLTYNLSVLYAYSLSVRDDEDDDDEGGTHPVISEIVLHRVVAVITGCIWGLIITRLVWPISARRKLKDGLSLIWLRMGLIWRRDPLSALLEGEHPNAYMNLREEFELQRFLSRLEKLQDAAKSEFELRGPFPWRHYNKILDSTGRMLDAFHAMNVVILKDLNASKGEAVLLKATIKERQQLCTRISHLFSVLASSMKLEYPLNDALPNIDHTRDRLLATIFRFRKEDENFQCVEEEDFGLLYAYALVTRQLSLDIQEVLKEVEDLFGVLDEETLILQ